MTTHKHPLPTSWPTLLLVIAVVVALMAMVGGCFGATNAVSLAWTVKVDGYRIYCNGQYQFSTPTTNCLIPLRKGHYEVWSAKATNRFNGSGPVFNLWTNK